MHPLRKEPKWQYAQPVVTVKTSLVAVGPGAVRGRVYKVQGAGGCREGTIHNLRQALLHKVTRNMPVQRGNPHGFSWRSSIRRVTHEVNLEDLRNTRPGLTTLAIRRGAIVPISPTAARSSVRRYRSGARNRAARNQSDVTNQEAVKFLHVADAIMGPIGVLINPDRPQGCCKASTTRNAGKNLLVWHGVDNTILYSPALVAMFAGLYRQCALLCKAGYADEILSVVDRSWIRETIEKVDEESALEIVQAMKKWIEVPIPRHGHRSNMVFPPGYFTRLLQISRAVEKHGPRAVFSEGFVKGWTLSARQVNGYGQAQRGLWTVWGTAKNGNGEYQKISKLSRSRKNHRPDLSTDRKGTICLKPNTR